MTSYVSVIRDSFREAMASRVLWLVLLLITAVLIAVVPFHWAETIGAKLDGTDIRSIRNIAAELKLGGAADASALQKRIWDAVDVETRRELDNAIRGTPGPHRFVARKRLADDFNRLIEQDDFFEPGLWDGIQFSSRLTELVETNDLSPERKQQRNRLALEAALPGMLKPCPEESVLFRYAKWDLSIIPPMTRTRAAEQIDFVVMLALPLFVGFFGIFAAVLVTAPIIPNMLASGSLNLLLSKPISRPLLFLAKFTGGCSFVFINVGYLVAGILLILGLRFQIWKPQLLWAIPIFLFSFAIFYSVSAISGLIWRSTVLAISMTVIFWVACVAVAATRGIMEQLVIVPDQIQQIVTANEQIFVQRRNSTVGRWNPKTQSIDEIMKTKDNQASIMMTGPKYQSMLYDAENEMLLALSRTWSESNIYAALRVNDWKRELPTKGPKNALAMFMRNGKPTIVAEDGVYTISMAQAEEPLPEINIFGLRIPTPAPKDTHERISEELARMPTSTRAAFSPRDDRIYLQSGRNLRVLAVDDERFTESASTNTELDEITHLTAGDGVVVVAHRQDARNTLHAFRSSDLSHWTTISPEGDDVVRSLSISADGRWLAMLTDDDMLAVFDLKTSALAWQKKGVVSAEFKGNELLTADQHDKLVVSSFPDGVAERQHQPKLPLVKRLYRYLVNPLYLAFPKPSELENTMRYALTGKDTQKVDAPGMGANGRTVKLDPWQPLYSNSVFIAVMLSFGCWYIHRQDF